MKIDLMQFLSTGEENAVTAREVSALTGLNSREITLAVNALRLSGQIICSTGAGYFLPADDDDIMRFVRQMRSRQREIGRAAKGARDYLKSQNGGADNG